MSWTSRQKLGIGLLVSLALTSSVVWKIVERAVFVESASTFLLPALVLGLMLIILFTGSILWKEKSLVALASAFVTVPSLFSALSLVHMILIIVASVIIYRGLCRIQSDLMERIHLSVRKSLSVGMTMVFLGTSLLLSSQYYVHVQQLPWERLVPSFNLAEGIGPIILRIITPFYPEIKQLSDNEVTVDGFLYDVQKREETKLLNELSPLSQKYLLQQELDRTKKQLSGLLGREVLGGENMQALLSEVIHRKTIALFSGEQKRLPVPVLPFFLSVLLFLTVYPIMNFLSPILIFGSVILFRIFRLAQWIEIRQETVKREVMID